MKLHQLIPVLALLGVAACSSPELAATPEASEHNQVAQVIEVDSRPEVRYYLLSDQ